MGLWKTSKKVASKLVDIRVDKWMGLDYVKDVSSQTGHILKDLVVPQKASRKESFEQALERLHLTEYDLAQRKIEFTRLVVIFLSLATGIIAYALYMIITGHPIASLVSFCLSLYTLSQAFRFHFWLFQIKNRKLGCTLTEWFNSKITEHA